MKANKVVKPRDGNLPAKKQKGEVVRGNFIRADAVLLLFPFFVLDKHNDSMELTLRDEHGVLWSIHFSSKYGIPRDLAYRVERLVLDAAIDAEVRRGIIPNVICAGTLRSICATLGCNSSGPNQKGIETALLQIVGTVIDTSAAARTQWQKFQSIYFTGQEKEDGTRSDAIYLRLSDEYKKALAESARRPLDADYIRDLPGAVARLYELLAPRIYGALKSGGDDPVARMLYSDICNGLGITRYPDWRRVYKQMYKLHKPHLDSGYFSKVTHRAKGEGDWMFDYVPGPRARREHDAVLKRGEFAPTVEAIDVTPDAKPTLELVPPQNSAIDISPVATPSATKPPAHEPTQELLDLPPNAPPTEAQQLAARLRQIGIGETRADALVERNLDGSRLWIDVHDRGLIPPRINDKAGYLIRMIWDKAGAPEKYTATLAAEARARAGVEAARQRDESARQWELEERASYDDFVSKLGDRLSAFHERAVAGLSAKEREQIERIEHPRLKEQAYEGVRFRAWQKWNAQQRQRNGG